MVRPPKRINQDAHKTVNHSTEDGRSFRKGRFRRGPREEKPSAESGDATLVELEPGETSTANAAFGPDGAATILRPSTGEAPPRSPDSKYEARPVAGFVAPSLRDRDVDAVVDLRGHREETPDVTVDLTKLPPVDPEAAEGRAYLRHSDGWPVAGS